jgi:hypothetical protein
MTAPHRRRRRRGYTLGVVLATSFIVLACVAIMASFVSLTWAQQRRLSLEAPAEQALSSVQAWTRVHAAQLAREPNARLALTDILPPDVDGTAAIEVSSADDGRLLVTCRIGLRRGSQALHRQGVWPLAR